MPATSFALKGSLVSHTKSEVNLLPNYISDLTSGELKKGPFPNAAANSTKFQQMQAWRKIISAQWLNPSSCIEGPVMAIRGVPHPPKGDPQRKIGAFPKAAFADSLYGISN